GNYATINIIDAIKRVPGVGDVVLFGSSDYAMRIWVTPDTLTRFNLTIAELQNAIRAQNVVNPAGQIGAEPAPAGQKCPYAGRARAGRGHGGPGQSRRLAGTPQGRLPHRAGSPELPAGGSVQRQARRSDRRLPDPRVQCPQGRRRDQEDHRRSEEGIPPGPG